MVKVNFTIVLDEFNYCQPKLIDMSNNSFTKLSFIVQYLDNLKFSSYNTEIQYLIIESNLDFKSKFSILRWLID